MNAKPRVVIKVGTGVLTDDSGRLNQSALSGLVGGLADLFDGGYSCLLVSSGAVGAGVGLLGLQAYPERVEARQACASLGQAELMRVYSGLFQSRGIKIAQLLLTAADLANQKRRRNAERALSELLAEGAILPIVNENDCVAVEELTFGDNDMLSVKVAELIGADTLILLTGVDGLMKGGPEGELIDEVSDLDDAVRQVSGGSGRFSIGGMANKLKAIEAARNAGISPIIANGYHPEQLLQIVTGGGRCTRFV